jgi:hypothetical protein
MTKQTKEMTPFCDVSGSNLRRETETLTSAPLICHRSLQESAKIVAVPWSTMKMISLRRVYPKVSGLAA